MWSPIRGAKQSKACLEHGKLRSPSSTSNRKKYKVGPCGCTLQGDEEEEKKGRKKRDKIKSALTRPLGPADPQHKGTELHLRMTYRECSEDQVPIWSLNPERMIRLYASRLGA